MATTRQRSTPKAGSCVGSLSSELVEARSRPTIEGWALAFSRRTFWSVSEVEITPRIAPLSLRCRVRARVGEEQDLTPVRRVCDGLLIADHARRKDHLACDLTFAGEAPSLEGRPILENQRCPAPPLALSSVTHVHQTLLQFCRVPSIHQL